MDTLRLDEINTKTGMLESEAKSGVISASERAARVCQWIELHWKGASPSDTQIKETEELIFNAMRIEGIRRIEQAVAVCENEISNLIRERVSTGHERLEYIAAGAKRCIDKIRETA